jgi:hypothetical protein
VQLEPPGSESVSVTEPALQLVHAIFVASGEYKPAVQPWHLVLPTVGTLPASHTSHLLAWLPLTVPVAHGLHSVVELGEYCPLVQPLHSMPAVFATPPLVSLATEPALQFAHATEFGPLYLPASQLSHDVMLLRRWYKPASQILQKALAVPSWKYP